MSDVNGSAVRRVVNVPGVPAPLAHKSMAVVSGSTVYVSGQIGKGEDGLPLPTVEEQAHQAFMQVKAILQACGSDLEWIVRTGIYVTDIEDLLAVSAVKKRLIPDEPPASFGMQVSALALGAAVEVEAIAVIPDGASH